MATKVGTKVLIKVASVVLVGQRATSSSMSATMIDVSNKLSGKHSEFEYGRITETLSVEGLVSTSKESTLKGYWDLRAAMNAHTKLAVVITEYADETGAADVDGAETLTYSALVSGLDASFPDNAENSFSCNLQITGVPVQSTNTTP